MGENGKVKECKQQLGAIAKELLLKQLGNNFIEIAQTVSLDLKEDFAGQNLSRIDLQNNNFITADHKILISVILI